jgi:CrcB protein
MHIVLIGFGGFLGAMGRYLVDGWVTSLTRGSLPFGTLAVNVSGSFAAGFLFVLLIERASLSAELRGPLLIGFIGAYTTFSTLALESWRLMEDGAWLAAGANLLGSILLGVVALGAGIALGRWL